jgi:hypothetical protein
LRVLAQIIDEDKAKSKGKGEDGKLSNLQIKYTLHCHYSYMIYRYASKDAWLGYMIVRRICEMLADDVHFVDWLQKHRPTEKEMLEFTK